MQIILDRSYKHTCTDSKQLSINRLHKMVAIFKKFYIFDFNINKNRIAAGGSVPDPRLFCVTVTPTCYKEFCMFFNEVIKFIVKCVTKLTLYASKF